MNSDKAEESEPIKIVLEAMSHARKRLSAALEEGRCRDINLLWRTYMDVEFSIGIGKFLVKETEGKLGMKRKIVISKKKDPLQMSPENLDVTIRAIDHELQKAEIGFQVMPSEDAIESARKARDELKMLILSSGKKNSSRD